MNRRTIISGLGPVSALGMGAQAHWEAAAAGASKLAPIEAFDPSGFACQVAGEVKDFKIRDYVPKTYRKATKVMARDIELAVAAADLAARDAGLTTKGTDPDAEPSYDPRRVGAHIGAGLIAADLDELTGALATSVDEQGGFDIHQWGSEGMNKLTPLWLLKYLPNMLACHVTIIHDTQGPSNTITCAEASSGLSIGESLRVIERGQADLCFCGGAESKLNPMAYLRQQLADRLTTTGNDDPAGAVRPFDAGASGSAIGEGGGIVVLEALETYEQRQGDKQAYAEIIGFAASQSVNRATRNRLPEPDGRGIALAIKRALAEAGVEPGQIDLAIGYGLGQPETDSAEAAALRTVFGDSVPAVLGTKALMGNCGAGAGSIDLALGAMALHHQQAPPIINRDTPLDGLDTPAPDGPLNHVLVYSAGFGGQNTAIVLKKMQG